MQNEVDTEIQKDPLSKNTIYRHVQDMSENTEKKFKIQITFVFKLMSPLIQVINVI